MGGALRRDSQASFSSFWHGESQPESTACANGTGLTRAFQTSLQPFASFCTSDLEMYFKTYFYFLRAKVLVKQFIQL